MAAPAAGVWYVMVRGYSSYAGLTLVGSFTPPPIQLQNGVTVSSVSGPTGSERYYYLSVPSGASNLSFVASGGSGDADLYVKFGSPPTSSDYNCRSIGSTNNENCGVTSPVAGNWYVLIKGYSSYSGLALTGSYPSSISQIDGLESDSILRSFLAMNHASASTGRFRFSVAN